MWSNPMGSFHDARQSTAKVPGRSRRASTRFAQPPLIGAAGVTPTLVKYEIRKSRVRIRSATANRRE